MARGDVYMVELPAARGAPTAEQVGSRPAVIVQVDEPGPFPTVVVVPLTSKLSALRYRHTIRIEPSPDNGLATTSVLLVFQLRAIDRARLIKRIGWLDGQQMEILSREIVSLLDL